MTRRQLYIAAQHPVPAGPLAMVVRVSEDGACAALWDDGVVIMDLESGETKPAFQGVAMLAIARDLSCGVTRAGDILSIETSERIGKLPVAGQYDLVRLSDGGAFVLVREQLGHGKGQLYRLYESSRGQLVGEQLDAEYGSLKTDRVFSRFVIRSKATRIWSAAAGMVEKLPFAKGSFCELTPDLDEARCLDRKRAKGGDLRDQMADEYSVRVWKTGDKRPRAVHLSPLSGLSRYWFSMHDDSLAGRHVFRHHWGDGAMMLTVSEVDEGKTTHEIDLGAAASVHCSGVLPSITTSVSGEWAATSIATYDHRDQYQVAPQTTRIGVLHLMRPGTSLSLAPALSEEGEGQIYKPIAISEGWLVALDISTGAVDRPRAIARFEW